MTPTPDATPLAADWLAQCEYLTAARGHRIAYRRRGSGPTMLLLHGFPTWSYDYAMIATDLEHDHDVVTLDFLGYGGSDKPRPYDYTVAESADIVEQLAGHRAYRPTTPQKLLALPLLGRLLSDRITAGRVRSGLDDVRGSAKRGRRSRTPESPNSRMSATSR